MAAVVIYVVSIFGCISFFIASLLILSITSLYEAQRDTLTISENWRSCGFFSSRFLAPASFVMASTSANAPTKKRKHPAAAVAVPDSRFEFSAEDLASPPPLDGTALAGPTSPTAQLNDADEDAVGEKEPGGLPAHLLPKSGKKNGTPGLIYFSRLPPGMGPAQIKHLLSAYGEVGRVFLARSSALFSSFSSFRDEEGTEKSGKGRR